MRQYYFYNGKIHLNQGLITSIIKHWYHCFTSSIQQADIQIFDLLVGNSFSYKPFFDFSNIIKLSPIAIPKSAIPAKHHSFQAMKSIKLNNSKPYVRNLVGKTLRQIMRPFLKLQDLWLKKRAETRVRGITDHGKL